MANTVPLIPLDEGDYKNEMFWGSYRPSVYFGMKTRSEHSITTGLLWGSPRDYRSVRHTCEHGDGLEKYGWTSHDGVNFGEQLIVDGKFNIQLTTSFYKRDPMLSSGGSWSNRFSAAPIKSSENAVAYWIYYINFPKGCTITQKPKSSRRGIDQILIAGTCEDIGDFTFIIKEGEVKGSTPQYNQVASDIKDIPDLSRFHYMGIEIEEKDQWKIGDMIKQELGNSLQKIYQNYQKLEKPDPSIIPNIIPTLPNNYKPNSNSFAFFKAYDSPFEVDVAFISHQSANNDGYFISSNQLPDDYINNFFGATLTSNLDQAKKEFEKKVDKKFLLKDAPGVDSSMENTAKYALSNLIGGMGYWEGKSLIYEGENKLPSTYSHQKLFSAVPSRPFFPRGFLWDEGFHQLLISEWDERITIDVLSYWFNLMHDDGWIPREQILGEEARSKVPPQYQPQHRDHANPPTLLMTVDKLIRKANNIIHKTLKSEGEIDIVEADLNPKINHVIEKYGNVNNLASILQFITNAFPRIEKWFNWFKTEQRGVIDNAFRWRGRLENHTLSSGLDDYPRSRFPSDKELHLDLICWMAYSAKILSNAALLTHNDPSVYSNLYESYLKNLELHWDESQGLYADIAAFREDSIKYVRHIGYVSLFPLLTGLIPSDSPRLKGIFDVIQDEKQLWTKYGLRSLSLSDSYYLKGDKYWTGPIWININYFVLSSLYRNYLGSGPNQQQAVAIYKELRKNLMENIVKEYERTGYIWEQYDQNNGRGSGTKPFTGWSALVVSIMSEKY